MRKMLILLVIAMVGGILLVSGCEETLVLPTTTTITPTTSTTTTTIFSGTATVSGTLYTGSVGASASDVKSFAVAQGYRIVAQNAATGEFKFIETDSSGRFTFTSPANETWLINIIDNNTQYTGPVVARDMGGSEAAMGIQTAAASVELGDVLINPSTGLIAPTAALDSEFVGSAEVARTDGNGVPVGVGNAGKGSAADYSGPLASGFDSDKDGLPNFVDADNNGNGVIDEVDPGSGVTTEAVVDNPRIESADVHANLDLGYDHVQNFNAAQYAALEFVVVPDASVIGSITSVRITSIPTRYANAELIDAQTIEGTSYPDHTLWSQTGAVGYGLGFTPASQSWSGVDQWSVYVRAGVQPQPGDVFVFQVNYSDGSSDEFSRMVNYAFSDITSLASYQVAGDIVRTAPATNEPSVPLTLAGTTEITLNYNRPADENSNTLTGFAYDYFIDLYKTYSASWPDSDFVDTVQGAITLQDDGSGSYITLHQVLPTAYGGQTIEAYRVAVRCTTPAGAGNASTSLMMYFNR
jgi:hypothetical protein